jgi:large subunit ribosomal protein L24
MKRIKKGDQIVVITGRDRGKLGEVRRVLENDRLVVEGINIVKKHRKPDPGKGVAGGIEEMEATIHVSNVALYDRSTRRPAKVGFKILNDGRKVRFFKKSGEMLDAV